MNTALLGLGLFTGVAAARVLGPHGRGTLALGISASLLATVVVGLGLQQACAYTVARHQGDVRGVFSLSLWSALALGALVAAGAWILAPIVVQDRGIATVLQISLAVTPLSAVALNLTGVVQGLRLGRRFNTLRLVPAVTYAIAMGSVIMLVSPVRPEALAAGFACSSVVAAATAIAIEQAGLAVTDVAHSPLPTRKNRIATRLTFGRWLEFSVPQWYLGTTKRTDPPVDATR